MLVADDALAQPPAEASGTVVTLGQVVTAQRLDTRRWEGGISHNRIIHRRWMAYYVLYVLILYFVLISNTYCPTLIPSHTECRKGLGTGASPARSAGTRD